jgi:hypothetical protein
MGYKVEHNMANSFHHIDDDHYENDLMVVGQGYSWCAVAHGCYNDMTFIYIRK